MEAIDQTAKILYFDLSLIRDWPVRLRLVWARPWNLFLQVDKKLSWIFRAKGRHILIEDFLGAQVLCLIEGDVLSNLPIVILLEPLLYGAEWVYFVFFPFTVDVGSFETIWAWGRTRFLIVFILFGLKRCQILCFVDYLIEEGPHSVWSKSWGLSSLLTLAKIYGVIHSWP